MFIRVTISILLLIGSSFHMGTQAIQINDGNPLSDHIIQASEEAKRILTALVKIKNMPGLSVAVGKDNRIIFVENWGWADIENQIPVNSQTKFRIGSVSKLLTAVGVARLYEQDLLDLDVPIQQYVPSFPEKKYIITSRQLAGHLSGIRHYRSSGFFNRRKYENVIESLEIFQNDSLLFRPGTRRHYSTYGYVLLSAVIEGASGQSFLSYMKHEVFTPLHMSSTLPEYADRLIYNRGSFYDRTKDGEIVNAIPEDYSYKWAGGGFMSTATDLVHFALSIVDGKFLKPETAELLFTPQKTFSGEEIREGIGWRPATDWKGRQVVHHGGSSEGARSFLLLYPKEKLAISILANISGAPIFEGEAETIAELFLNNNNFMSYENIRNISGQYTLTTIIDKEKVEEQIVISSSKDFNYGFVSFFNSENSPIVSVTSNDKLIRLTIATSRGLVNMWLKFYELGFTGKWGYDIPKWEVKGEKAVLAQATVVTKPKTKPYSHDKNFLLVVATNS